MADERRGERTVQRRRHPGSGRGRGLAHPKGRQVDADALDEIRALLGERPRRRDLLIEHLHAIQDRFNFLSAAHLTALAEEMHLPLAEVYEVATFYSHFRVSKEGEAALPKVTVRVCDSVVCEMMGGRELFAELLETLGSEVAVVRASCMGQCDRAPVVEVERRCVMEANASRVAETVARHDFAPQVPSYSDYDRYVSDGGYGLFRECLEGRRTRNEVVLNVEDAGLRGLGGAGFPTGRKWRMVRRYPRPRLMVVNADEGEPGTYKDRYFLERDPHRFLEGTLIAGWVVEAEAIYIYLRDEYGAVREILLKEISRLEQAGLTADIKIHLRRGAGAYICGEESAMIESIEGKRGLPRHRPPYVAETGLFGRPTLVQNVETLYWVRDLLEKGPEWFSGHGRRDSKGIHAYSVSGRVNEPGVKVAPAGITVRELIHEYCGGMREGHEFKAFLTGGASGGVLPASMADIPLDFGSLEKYGCFVGSHAIVVLSDRDDIKGVALNLMRFFRDESCGQCTPCRVGTEKAVALMEQSSWDEPLLEDLAQAMTDASICGLGQAAPNSLRCVLKYFREDLS
jgi:NADH:ubiquinone oxidoreductase subunit F (NADH-binding)/NADH:ubiquinone oxidoreductase subunit E